MAWVYLVLAGLCEIGWPIGLKNGWDETGLKPLWVIFAVISMTISGALLLMAQREIPIGTAYAVWTGLGAVGTFFVGVLVYGDSAAAMRLASIAFIIVGIIGLKLS